jgi:phosphoribosyl 1,2-cyclic phosphodiesterase/CheY-like chemotaxis protein
MKTIVVIDDDTDVRRVLAELLRRNQWEVLEAANGDRGIELARRHRPHAILCDLLMPGTNGFTVCSTIRADRTLRYSLLLAMSGRGFEDNRIAALESGADEFLAKPIDPSHLLSLLNSRTSHAPAALSSSRPWVDTGEGEWVRFWGVRGSVPVPGPDTVRYGGNTACIEVRVGGEIIILDSGTGIRALGEALDAEFGEHPRPVTLLVSHLHWDHVQGFPFFKLLYTTGRSLRVLGFEGPGESLASVFAKQMQTPHFPISLAQLPAHVQFEELHSLDFSIGSVRVQAAFVNHPGICVGYRLSTERFSVAYAPDHEPFIRTCLESVKTTASEADRKEFGRREDERILEFLHGADLLILDSQFEAEEYVKRVGWGHSSVEDAVDMAVRAQAKRLCLFHHDPSHSDEQIDRMAQYARKLASKAGSPLIVEAAQEGARIEFSAAVPVKGC